MVKLYKFYDLISRNANVTITNEKLDKTYFDGTMKDIPNTFDDCDVVDFCVSSKGDFLFKIK